MKKLFKNPIFTFILGAIAATTISVGATALYSSSEIGFTPTDSEWHVNNLEDAINDLSTNRGNFTGTLSSSPIYETSQGTPTTERTISKELSKGKYLVVSTKSESWGDTGSYAAGQDAIAEGALRCNSGCTITFLGGYRNMPKATNPISSNYKIMTSGATILYYVEVTGNTSVLSDSATAANTYNTGAQFVTLQAYPID